MNKNIFHKTSIKLTGLYLLIIMAISLIFSIGLFKISSQELESGIRRQYGPVGQALRGRYAETINQADLIAEQESAINVSKERLLNNLLLINILILLSGGLLSYYLARRTLSPIEEAHEAQSRFTADASHELRTPITAMRVENELSLTDKNLTLKKARDQLESNIEELDKLTELSAGLLQLSRIDNNGLEKSQVELKKVLETAISKVLPHAEAKKQLITVAKSNKLIISANETSLAEAIVTILDNAIKYSPPKSEIEIKITETKQKVLISIIDKGVGIKASDLPHIFERFYRADQSRNKTHVNGYGLGLSIAKSIIETHQGQISARSTPGKGTTFTISLPIK